MRQMKIRGGAIEGLPARAVLDHPDSPAPVVEAVASWDAAREESRQATEIHRTAEKAAQESTLLVKGERARWLAEVREKVVEEQSDARRAARVAQVAAEALVTVLKEHATEVDALAARLTLVAYAAQVDATIEAQEARGCVSACAPIVPRHPMLAKWDTHGTIGERMTERSLGGPLERLDLSINALALAEIAGDRCGLVEVRAIDQGGQLLTTPRRAAMLADGANQTHRSRWALADEDEEVSGVNREEIARMTREEVAEHGDEAAAEVARREIREESEADEIYRAARERRGY